MADLLIKAPLVKDLEIPVFVGKELNVRHCVMGYDRLSAMLKLERD